jgi:hypothetical protein
MERSTKDDRRRVEMMRSEGWEARVERMSAIIKPRLTKVS